MSEAKITKGFIEIDAGFYEFVEKSLLPGLGRSEDNFWDDLGKFLVEFSPRVENLLRIRDDFQSQIDQWHLQSRGQPHDDQAYFNFLTEIGLDETSVVGADEWGKQMEEMLTEMTAQLKALGYIK